MRSENKVLFLHYKSQNTTLLKVRITMPNTKQAEYFFVDYFCNDDNRWVRSPFNTREQVLDKTKIALCTGSNLRIQKETDLDELVTEDGVSVELTRLRGEEVKEDEIMTKREYLFGDTYQGCAEMIRSGKLQPADLGSF